MKNNNNKTNHSKDMVTRWKVETLEKFQGSGVVIDEEEERKRRIEEEERKRKEEKKRKVRN